tara:strand:+ start:6778 stop:8508 length:1731 start_codon:yes stop_codon:yes gene_type:complete
MTTVFSFAQDVYQSAGEIINAFNDRPVKNNHITSYLLDIARNGHQLDSDSKAKLESLGFNFNGTLISRGQAQRSESIGLDKYFDVKYFRIHYTTSGRNAVNPTDINLNDIPDYIESLADIFSYVSKTLHDDMGFIKPPGDGFYSSDYDNGGNDKYDIYIRQLASNFYGYVQFEQYAQEMGDNEKTPNIIEKNAITSYMAMRNGYTNFNQLTELQNIQTTIAHEFFHTIQLGYDGWEKQWLLEATAVWMEEELFDDINDVYQYMPEWFKYPHRSLDEEGTHAYGSYIFFEFIEQNMGGNETLRIIFENSVKNDSRIKDGSHSAIDQALKLNGYTFKQALNSMSIANKIMSSASAAGVYKYEEAESYPIKGPTIYKTLNFKSGTMDFIESSRLNRFGSQYISIISQEPVLVELNKINGSSSNLKLNAILEKNDDSFLVISNKKINIDPINLKSIHLSIVSEDTIDLDLSYRLTFKDGERGTGANLPITFIASNPYPNPFKNDISFLITILQETFMRITVYDLMGREIRTIYNGQITSGSYKYKWDSKNNFGIDNSSGTYFIKISDGQNEEWKMITLIK